MTKLKPMRDGLLAMFVSAAMGSTPALADAKEQSWVGFLVDCNTQKTMQRTIKKQPDVQSRLSQYARDVALADSARSSGYALFVNGKFYELDSSGNKLAQQNIEKSVKKTGFYVMVKGARQHKHIRVSSISDASDFPANSNS